MTHHCITLMLRNFNHVCVWIWIYHSIALAEVAEATTVQHLQQPVAPLMYIQAWQCCIT